MSNSIVRRRWSRPWHGHGHRSAARSETCRWCRKQGRRALLERVAQPSHESSSQAILVAEKYGSSRRPVFCRDRGFVAGGCKGGAGIGAVPAILPDDGAMATGFPVLRVPEDDGLALVGDADGGEAARGSARRCAMAPAAGVRPPMSHISSGSVHMAGPERSAATPAAPSPPLADRLKTIARLEVVPWSCSTQPGFGKCWANSFWAEPAMPSRRSKAIARVEVVP